MRPSRASQRARTMARSLGASGNNSKDAVVRMRQIYPRFGRWLAATGRPNIPAMDNDRLLRELTEFLRIPSISTLPANDQDCRRAAEWVAADLRRLGCTDVQLLASETHPVVWGVGPVVPGAPTLVLYGHYDVQPPDPLDEWTTPPFEPTLRDGKLYARGSADDKGQVFCLLRALVERGGRPPVNFRFLIEGEEEYGSRVLFELLRRGARGRRARGLPRRANGECAPPAP